MALSVSKMVWICKNIANQVTVDVRGHASAVIIHSPPTSEVCVSNPRSHIGKLVVAY